jgi:hypothetical protein
MNGLEKTDPFPGPKRQGKHIVLVGARDSILYENATTECTQENKGYKVVEIREH